MRTNYALDPPGRCLCRRHRHVEAGELTGQPAGHARVDPRPFGQVLDRAHLTVRVDPRKLYSSVPDAEAVARRQGFIAALCAAHKGKVPGSPRLCK